MSVKQSLIFRAKYIMNVLNGLFFVALIYGSTAFPTPEDNISTFFNYADPEARIVGGSQAPLGSHPHMVAFSTGAIFRAFHCGGSIISRRHVLTAAHCINAWYGRDSVLISSLRATVGTNQWNSGGISYTLARNITHPNYLADMAKNDLGILVTNSDIQYTNLIQPVVLNFDFVGAGVPVVVAGWGRIRNGGAISATLLQIFTSTIDGQRCVVDTHESMLANGHEDAPPVEPHIEICTFHSAGVGNCHGDSGSALLRSDSRQQVGVVSWGVPCAVGGPDMYVRLSAFRSWIQGIIG